MISFKPLIAISSIIMSCLCSIGNTSFAQISSEIIYNRTEQMPMFALGDGTMLVFINTNLVYPPAALREGIEGKVMVSFTVNKKGILKDIVISKSVAASVDSEALRIVRLMPNWTPGKHNDETVNVKYTLPIIFDTGAYNAASKYLRHSTDSTEDVVPLPSYDLIKFFTDSLVYPEEALLDARQVIIRVKFVINENGSISDPRIVNPGHYSRLEDEALRVVRIMPKWKPGIQGGKPVKVNFTVPVAFSIRH